MQYEDNSLTFSKTILTALEVFCKFVVSCEAIVADSAKVVIILLKKEEKNESIGALMIRSYSDF